jgi:hypothetical protein
MVAVALRAAAPGGRGVRTQLGRGRAVEARRLRRVRATVKERTGSAASRPTRGRGWRGRGRSRAAGDGRRRWRPGTCSGEQLPQPGGEIEWAERGKWKRSAGAFIGGLKGGQGADGLMGESYSGDRWFCNGSFQER